MTLGKPERIFGNVKLSFRGEGDVRFRVMHTRDRYGFPDDLCWADVSRINDRSVEPLAAIERDDMKDPVGIFHVLPLLDRVQGDVEIVYRRYVPQPGDLGGVTPADWLKVLAGDEDDKAMIARCQTYRITVEPVA